MSTQARFLPALKDGVSTLDDDDDHQRDLNALLLNMG
jgi:hypothetical protein